MEVVMVSAVSLVEKKTNCLHDIICEPSNSKSKIRVEILL